MSDIIFAMLCPRVAPTVSANPSITLSYSGDKLIGVGTTLPVESDFTTSVNRGRLSDGTPYAGECGDVTVSMVSGEWGAPSEEGVYSVVASGVFEDGPMPKDTHKYDVESLQFKGKTVDSNTVKIVSVYPVEVNDNDILVMTPRLVDYSTLQTIYVTIPEEADEALSKFRVNLPCEFTTFDVKQYNEVSKAYDIDIEMSLLDGEISKYIRTTDVKDTFTGPAKYEIKLKK